MLSGIPKAIIACDVQTEKCEDSCEGSAVCIEAKCKTENAACQRCERAHTQCEEGCEGDDLCGDQCQAAFNICQYNARCFTAQEVCERRAALCERVGEECLAECTVTEEECNTECDAAVVECQTDNEDCQKVYNDCEREKKCSVELTRCENEKEKCETVHGTCAEACEDDADCVKQCGDSLSACIAKGPWEECDKKWKECLEQEEGPSTPCDCPGEEPPECPAGPGEDPPEDEDPEGEDDDDEWDGDDPDDPSIKPYDPCKDIDDTDRKYIPDLRNCYYYWACVRGVGWKYKCPADWPVFDWRQQMCVKGKRRQYCDKPFCGKQDRGRICANRIKDQCGRYRQCLNGTIIGMQCPEGYKFDDINERCQLDWLADCLDCPAKDTVHQIKYYPDRKNCNGFYVCSRGVFYPQKCHPLLHFNEDKNRCDDPKVAQCKYEKYQTESPAEVYGQSYFEMMKLHKEKDGKFQHLLEN